MERPEPGLPLLRAVLKQIDDHPETHDQSVMARKTACETALCVAGHAVALRGHKLQFDEDGDEGQAYYTTDGERIWDLAERELEIDEDWSYDLFYAENSREDIQRIAEQIAADRGEAL